MVVKLPQFPWSNKKHPIYLYEVCHVGALWLHFHLCFVQFLLTSEWWCPLCPCFGFGKQIVWIPPVLGSNIDWQWPRKALNCLSDTTSPFEWHWHMGKSLIFFAGAIIEEVWKQAFVLQRGTQIGNPLLFQHCSHGYLYKLAKCHLQCSTFYIFWWQVCIDTSEKDWLESHIIQKNDTRKQNSCNICFVLMSTPHIFPK